MKMKNLSPRGFTLIELVIVIVITGVIAGIIALFIRAPVEGYADSAARAELTDAADTALRRIARDVRLALPNSIRTTANANGDVYLELLLTKTGGRYLSDDDGAAGAKPVLDFANVANTTFYVVGAMPAGRQAVAVNDRIVVYNLGPGFMPADAYDCSLRCNRARVTAVNTAAKTITLAANPFAQQAVADATAYPIPTVMASPFKRFQVVSTPVTYVCSQGQLIRYWNYAISAVQPTTVAALTTAEAVGPAPARARLANNVPACAFSYGGVANTRSGLVGMRIDMQNPATPRAGTVSLFQQVHVDNTP